MRMKGLSHDAAENTRELAHITYAYMRTHTEFKAETAKEQTVVDQALYAF